MLLRLNKKDNISVLNGKDPSIDGILKKCLAGKDSGKITVCIATDYAAGNYGDLLARYIVEQLSGKAVVKYPENNIYHLDSVGSVLNRNEMCSNAVVWGSGFLSPQAYYKIKLTKFRQWIRRKTGRPLYLAVRGQLTREILLKSGYQCPAVYADPALVMPQIYYPKQTKKFELGIVLHWSQEKFIPLFENIPGVKIININRKYETLNTFVDEILQCKAVLSSSLHGLIIANAYKIPCVRLKILNNPIAASEHKDDFKFEDYLSGLNSCKCEKDKADYIFNTLFLKPGKEQCGILINQVQTKATVPDFKIDLTPLIQAFPFLAERYKGRKFIID